MRDSTVKSVLCAPYKVRDALTCMCSSDTRNNITPLSDSVGEEQRQQNAEMRH